MSAMLLPADPFQTCLLATSSPSLAAPLAGPCHERRRRRRLPLTFVSGRAGRSEDRGFVVPEEWGKSRPSKAFGRCSVGPG